MPPMCFVIPECSPWKDSPSPRWRTLSTSHGPSRKSKSVAGMRRSQLAGRSNEETLPDRGKRESREKWDEEEPAGERGDGDDDACRERRGDAVPSSEDPDRRRGCCNVDGNEARGRRTNKVARVAHAVGESQEQQHADYPDDDQRAARHAPMRITVQ